MDTKLTLKLKKNAAKLFTLADEEKIIIAVSALTIANIHYLLSKQLSGELAKQVLRKFKILVQIVPVDDKIIDLALNSEFFDFEVGRPCPELKFRWLYINTIEN